MKRTIAIAAAACTLAVPAIALGQTFQGIFNGHLESSPDSSVTLKFSGAVDPDGGTQSSVHAFVVRDFTVACENGITATLEHAKLKGNFKIGDGKNFRARDNNGRTIYKVSGHVGANKAFGSFRLTGKIETTDGVDLACDSGPLGWVARP